MTRRIWFWALAVSALLGAGAAAHPADRARIPVDLDAPRIDVAAPDGAAVPELLRYIAPAQTTQIAPGVRVEGTCRLVFDVLTDGTTDNVRACCVTRDARNQLGQPVLERGVAAAAERWRFRPDYDAFVYQMRDVSGLIWFENGRFNPEPTDIRRSFLPDAPAAEHCVFSDDILIDPHDDRFG